MDARAVRLIVEYDGDQMRLVSQQDVDVDVDAQQSSPPPAPGKLAVETRGQEGAALQRVLVPVPIPHSLEVFPENSSGRIERIDVDTPVGAFTVVVPVTDGARRFAVVRGATSAPGAPGVGPSATAPRQGDDGEVLATFDVAPGAAGETAS